MGVFKGWIEVISEKQKNIFKKNLMGKILPGMVRDLNVQSGGSTKKSKVKSKVSANGNDMIE